MKRFLATTTAAATLLIAPAYAQQASPPLIAPDAASDAAIQQPAQPSADITPAPDVSAEANAETAIEVGADLPVEVAEIVADGDYDTEDLVLAQLAALQAQPLSAAPPSTEGTVEAEPALDPAG